MTTMIPSRPDSGTADVGTPGTARKTRGIRFSHSEWEEIKAASERSDLTAAEFVRMACLDAARADKEVDTQPSATDLAPLVERTFRYCYLLATLKRDELIQDGRGDEVERLITTAREIQDELRSDRTK